MRAVPSISTSGGGTAGRRNVWGSKPKTYADVLERETIF